jgi:hypothetical protein
MQPAYNHELRAHAAAATAAWAHKEVVVIGKLTGPMPRDHGQG